MALLTYQSLINFKELRAHGIHTFTMVKDHEEALELRQRTKVIATAYIGATGLYELSITNGTHPHTGLQTSLASVVFQSQIDIPQESVGSMFSMTFATKTGLWQSCMGHPGITMFRRMISIILGHVLRMQLLDETKIRTKGTCQNSK